MTAVPLSVKKKNQELAFLTNLAEVLDEAYLQSLSNDLEKFENDKSSREEWEQGYTKGLDLLVLNMKNALDLLEVHLVLIHLC